MKSLRGKSIDVLSRGASILVLVLAIIGVCVGSADAENHALVIGIDEYQDRNNINSLSAAAADAKAIAKTLQSVCGFPAENIRLLTSDGDPKPTGSNIVFELEQLAKRVKPGDVVFIFYSGHGILMDGVGYLVPWDTDGRTEATLKRSAVPTSVFQEQLGKLSSRALLLAFDMCRSDPRKGGARDVTPTNSLTEAQARSLVVKPRTEETAAGPQATVTLFSCSPRERSWEWRSHGRGYFSYYLEEGLKQAAADAQGSVRVKNLVSYLEKAVYGAVQREEGKEQTPYSVVEGSGASDLVLASGRPAGESGTTAVPTAPAAGAVVTLKEKIDSFMQQGSELFQQKKYDLALHKFDLAVELDPQSAKAVFWLGRTHDYLNHIAEAEPLYRKAIELDPKFAFPISSLGFVYYNRKDYVEAERLYRKAIEVDPTFARTYLGLGLLFYEVKKEYAETERLYKKAIELDPNWAIGYNNLGNVNYYIKKDYVEAERLYKNAIERDPNDANAYCNLANLTCDVKKEYVEAERLYKKAIELDPRFAIAYCNYGLLFYEVKKDYIEAERLYKKGIESNSNFAGAYLYLGNLNYSIKKDYAEAEKLYRKAIELDAQNGLYHANLALALLDQNRRVEAETEARKAIALGYREQHSVFDSLGIKP